MTERGDSSKGFLERWSRKKIDAERETPDAEKKTAPQEQLSSAAPVAQPPSVPKPEFDLASLPSIESITAATDVRPFLMPGVPSELARAALRRAWAADPAIRDFVGLAENAWDFTDPSAVAGFGDLPPGLDIKKLLAEVFGDNNRPLADATVPESQETAQIAPPAPSIGPESAAKMPRQQQIASVEGPPSDSDIAAHNSDRVDESEERKRPRQHGGALPQ